MIIRRYFCNARIQAARINHLESSLERAEARLHKTTAELKQSEHKMKKLRTSYIYCVTTINYNNIQNELFEDRKRKKMKSLYRKMFMYRNQEIQKCHRVTINAASGYGLSVLIMLAYFAFIENEDDTIPSIRNLDWIEKKYGSLKK